VLHGINALHSIDLVHGAIHPNNVLVNKLSGDVVVADYDFTKTPVRSCVLKGFVFNYTKVEFLVVCTKYQNLSLVSFKNMQNREKVSKCLVHC